MATQHEESKAEEARSRETKRPTLPMQQRRPDNPAETQRRKERASFLRDKNRTRSRKR